MSCDPGKGCASPERLDSRELNTCRIEAADLCTHAHADNDVWPKTFGFQHLQHADMCGSSSAPTGEHQTKRSFAHTTSPIRS